ncbi:DUF4326 domain-containing protein [Massilia sp. MS-15]|uniref:DUF4326 domain-containing protein n=1 Tax=Massilia sp. MS-15 TaxID=2878200 RepID=UPI001CD34460|nr:DUF4326 domain-containing protein [Massilia sp. MS-15]MCA1247501.1 DUF4326 domain-containing protein [Massilia sp. MS-15]
MSPVRVQLSRKKGWKLPPNTVSVARPGRWGNPFSVLPELAPGTPVGTRYVAMPSVAEAVAAFRRWVEQDPAGQCLALEARTALRGRNLACWCPLDGPCHAEVLLEIANR